MTFRIPRPVAPAFTRLLWAQGLSKLGVGFHLAAFPLLVSTLTTDPLVVATTALASVVPGIALALPVGAWVDRAHRGRLMVSSDLSCAAMLLALTVLVLTGHTRLWMVHWSLMPPPKWTFGVPPPLVAGA